MTITDIQKIRIDFNGAITNQDKALILHAQLMQLKPASNTIEYAYLGATEALLAKHSFNPFSKLSYVNSALEKLNKAVDINSSNLEIRYMRFSVEANMPPYLGYSKHVSEDKQILVQGLKSVQITPENCEMYLVFANGIINSAYCNKEEKKLLSNVVSTCNKVKQIKN